MIDVVIVGARDRASRIEGDVRSQRREHPKPSDRVDHAQLLVRAQWDLGYRAACENRIARRRQVFDEPPFLPQLRSIDRRVGTRQPSFVVIAPDGQTAAAAGSNNRAAATTPR